jgi:hypothetical protein
MMDEFRNVEKQIRQYGKCLKEYKNLSNYKSNCLVELFDWNNSVIDVRQPTENVVQVVATEIESLDKQLLNKNLKIYSINTLPEGFYVITNALSRSSQLYWARKALVEYSKAEHTNLTNLEKLSNSYNSGSAALKEEKEIPLNQDTMGKFSDSLHDANQFKSFFKLRWSCLGYHYGQFMFCI